MMWTWTRERTFRNFSRTSSHLLESWHIGALDPTAYARCTVPKWNPRRRRANSVHLRGRRTTTSPEATLPPSSRMAVWIKNECTEWFNLQFMDNFWELTYCNARSADVTVPAEQSWQSPHHWFLWRPGVQWPTWRQERTPCGPLSTGRPRSTHPASTVELRAGDSHHPLA